MSGKLFGSGHPLDNFFIVAPILKNPSKIDYFCNISSFENSSKIWSIQIHPAASLRFLGIFIDFYLKGAAAHILPDTGLEVLHKVNEFPAILKIIDFMIDKVDWDRSF